MKRSARQFRPANRHRPFTLLEVLAAVAMFAVVVAALLSATFGALRVRERTEERMEALLPIRELVRRVKADLSHAMPPGGVLAEDFVGTNDETPGGRLDSLEFASCVGFGPDSHESDLVRIEYVPETPETGEGYDLVRRALPSSYSLSESPEDVEGDVVAGGIASVAFSYYDSDSGIWTDSWDSSEHDGALPAVISLRIEFLPRADGSPQPPVEVLAMPGIAPLPAAEEESGSGSASGTGAPGGGGGGA